jgi:hypothetical protein
MTGLFINSVTVSGSFQIPTGTEKFISPTRYNGNSHFWIITKILKYGTHDFTSF